MSRSRGDYSQRRHAWALCRRRRPYWNTRNTHTHTHHHHHHQRWHTIQRFYFESSFDLVDAFFMHLTTILSFFFLLLLLSFLLCSIVLCSFSYWYSLRQTIQTIRRIVKIWKDFHIYFYVSTFASIFPFIRSSTIDENCIMRASMKLPCSSCVIRHVDVAWLNLFSMQYRNHSSHQLLLYTQST